jgi:hypothetical protein
MEDEIMHICNRPSDAQCVVSLKYVKRKYKGNILLLLDVSTGILPEHVLRNWTKVRS